MISTQVIFQLFHFPIYIVIAASSSFTEILQDWEYIENHLMPTLTNFENDSDVTDFIKCKIESLLQMIIDQNSLDNDNQSTTKDVVSSVAKFIKLFSMPEEEKLVNCKYLYFLLCKIICNFLFKL